MVLRDSSSTLVDDASTLVDDASTLVDDVSTLFATCRSLGHSLAEESLGESGARGGAEDLLAFISKLEGK